MLAEAPELLKRWLDVLAREARGEWGRGASGRIAACLSRVAEVGGGGAACACGALPTNGDMSSLEAIAWPTGRTTMRVSIDPGTYLHMNYEAIAGPLRDTT